MNKIIIAVLICLFGQILYSQERHIVTSDSVDLYVEVKGQGAPCLYIHGGPGSGSYWFEKFYGETMEKHFTVIYLDQRGVARSGSPENGNFSLGRMIKDFEEIKNALGYDTWFTLGHSFGGILQLAYAEMYPKSQDGLMMINTTLHLNKSFCESWAPKAFEFLREEYVGCDNDTLPLMERMGYLGNRLREKDLFWKMAYFNKENQAIMDATFQEIENWNFDFGGVAFSIEDYWMDFLPQTQHVTAPVLFFYGETDYMVGPKHYKEVKFPNMLLWKNQGGHIPFQENQKELTEAILTFKKKVEDSPIRS
ncbi:MAG: alpha/beta hydrolase [Flavobacteriaceae bacterium]|nr:alpha/beta hydrolase [Flavobacteriaceae bacterium]